MEKLRVAIVGCGMIAIKRHFPEMAENPNVEIVACTDYVKERAEDMAKLYGGVVCGDYKEIIEKVKPDAMVICADNATHEETAIAALNAGIHVLCEKPLTTSLESGKRIIQAAEKSGKKLMVAQNQRMSAAFKKAKEILKSGKLGKVLTFSTKFGHPGAEYWAVDGNTGSWFFDKNLNEYGCIADLGVHKLDLLRWLLEEEFEDASAFTAVCDKTKPNGEPVEVADNMVAILRSKSGIIGTIATSWTYYGPEDNSLVVYCKNGILNVMVDEDFLVKITYPDGSEECYKVAGVGTNEHPIKTGIDDEFIDSILEDRDPLITGIDGYNSLAVSIAIAESAKKGTLEKVIQYPN
ncbi:Gfo/Idh/MocA family protein [Luxibacter massiliensis]|uniref:Gfo/Idh/MocA family protein n=1 Tax=Luxibacter massiliensis TaxID=2219695 RepID=UPI000F06F57C|nr:Gfo/Idh/MocA family oxidoreductase [Luxibacter massiliensis]